MRLTEKRWKELVDGFDPGFWAHVKEAVFGNQAGYRLYFLPHQTKHNNLRP